MPVSADMASIFKTKTVLQNTKARKTGLVRLIASITPAILNQSVSQDQTRVHTVGQKTNY